MASSIQSSVVWPHYNTSNVVKASTKTNELGKDQFLGLLVAQLQNQDPLSPMDNTQYIAQMAQFSSVEQLINMKEEISLLRLNIGTASSLIGKHVTWNEYDNAGEIVQRSGLVDSIISQDGHLFVQVGGEKIGMDFIGQISSTPIENDNSSDQEESEPTDSSSSEEVME
ncbi:MULTISPECIES: flagellar hook capping FlgD N-terminal domain-containing protein [Paenibacillus]|uniref:flagellar hook capping FlgD N-terminal domain-containing protein n=1 Tax=Paenibacillus TaxID=44249 RepID=UPI002041C92A|nr:flagellar hook capping FlgD N-terminal domain-containing protein [Paenibacillus camelliae]MCM3632034.1 flagellar hook capping protein [Paenibacillus camelliae]